MLGQKWFEIMNKCLVFKTPRPPDKDSQGPFDWPVYQTGNGVLSPHQSVSQALGSPGVFPSPRPLPGKKPDKDRHRLGGGSVFCGDHYTVPGTFSPSVRRNSLILSAPPIGRDLACCSVRVFFWKGIVDDMVWCSSQLNPADRPV